MYYKIRKLFIYILGLDVLTANFLLGKSEKSPVGLPQILDLPVTHIPFQSFTNPKPILRSTKKKRNGRNNHRKILMLRQHIL